MSFSDHASPQRYLHHLGLPTRQALGDAFDLRCELSDAQYALDRRAWAGPLNAAEQVDAIMTDLGVDAVSAYQLLEQLGLRR